MDKELWRQILRRFREVSNEKSKLFEEYETLVLNESHDIVVLTSEPWRSDTAPMLLDYCIRKGLPFEVVNNHAMWMNMDDFVVYKTHDIPDTEIDEFAEYLNSSVGPVLHTKDAPENSNYSLYNVDVDSVFFQYLIIKYGIVVDSIFTRNLNNVSLHNR